MKRLILTFSILSFVAQTSLAGEVVGGTGGTQQECTSEMRINCTITQGNTTTTTTTNQPEGTSSGRPMSGFTSTTTSTLGTGLGDAGTGAYLQAQAAKQQAQSTMMMGLALGAMFLSQCGPRNPAACMLGAAALAAAAMAAGKKAQAQNLMNTLGTGQDSSTGPTTTTTTDSTDTSGQQLTDLTSDLAKKGYKYGADGSITTPSGSVVAGDLNEKSVADAGFSSADNSSIQSGLDKMRKDMTSALKNADGAAEGESSAETANALSGAYGGDGTPSGSGSGRGLATASKTLDKNPEAWDGYYKQFGDSLIGVGNADIFLMVEKRVENERKLMGQ